MKIRYGHVSNSSSSSFTININDSYPHYAEILIKLLEQNASEYPDSWDITIEDDTITCDTMMNNFNLEDYCVKVLGIPESMFDADEDY